jgi:hypothetical protein
VVGNVVVVVVDVVVVAAKVVVVVGHTEHAGVLTVLVWLQHDVPSPPLGASQHETPAVNT